MAAASEHAAGEVESLRRCINDLVSIQALPAIWAGGEPVQIVNTLLEALVGMLGLDFVYARVVDPMGAPPIEMVRTAHSHGHLRQRDLGEILEDQLGHDARHWPPALLLLLDREPTVVVPLPLGLRGEGGWIVAGSRKIDFPQQTERLILTVAVNQAVIGLQEAQLRMSQRRAAKELDHRVAQRTAELAATNAELKLEAAERKRADEALDKARSELAHVTRVMSLGAMTASIAHEVNQPLSGIITNGSTCLRMLAAEPPNIDGARETARRTIRDGSRAAEVIARLRALFAKEGTVHESIDLNDAAREVIALSLSELQRNRVVLRQDLAANLPPVSGDRVQLQQVILNLLLNASDAMGGIDDRPRELLIRTEPDAEEHARVSVRDTGTGFEAGDVDKLFTAFYTTKRGGMGIGLSVSRSIIENHRGRLWASVNEGPGATFAFSIPRHSEG